MVSTGGAGSGLDSVGSKAELTSGTVIVVGSAPQVINVRNSKRAVIMDSFLCKIAKLNWFR